MDEAITYVGLDVHKDTIAVALAEAGVRGDVREYWEDREHAGGCEVTGSEAVARWERASVLLRGRTLRLWGSSVDPRGMSASSWLRRDPAQTGADQDEPGRAVASCIGRELAVSGGP